MHQKQHLTCPTLHALACQGNLNVQRSQDKSILKPPTNPIVRWGRSRYHQQSRGAVLGSMAIENALLIGLAFSDISSKTWCALVANEACQWVPG